MKKLMVLFLVIQVYVVAGQNIAPDTVFVKRDGYPVDTFLLRPSGVSYPQVLVGTTLLPYSNKMLHLLNHGISGISLEILEGCDGSAPPYYPDYPKFLNVIRESTILTIDVSIAALCCYNFLGEAEVIGDTLNLIYTPYGGACSCDCCYTLRYKFDTYMEESYQVLKYLTINGHKPSTAAIPDVQKRK